MPRGRPKKMAYLQANDAMNATATNAFDNTEGAPLLTDEQIMAALHPYKQISVDLTAEHWVLTLRKTVYDSKNRPMGSGDVKVMGTRSMPIKDLLYSVRELMIPITAVSV